MDIVSIEWFEKNGFTFEKYKTGNVATLMEGSYGEPNFKIARWDYRLPEEDGDTGFYMFYAHGNGFEVSNKVSEIPFTIEQIIHSLALVGFKNSFIYDYFDKIYND